MQLAGIDAQVHDLIALQRGGWIDSCHGQRQIAQVGLEHDFRPELFGDLDPDRNAAPGRFIARIILYSSIQGG